MKSMLMTPIKDRQVRNVPGNSADDVIELGLLLPANRAAELLRLAQDRHESVGQLLRRMIDRELSNLS